MKFLALSPYLITFVLLLGIAFSTYKIISSKTIDLPGMAVPIQPLIKIKAGETHSDYSSNPPTSGWYVESNLRDGIFTTPITDEQIVNHLVKGNVGIFYNCTYHAEKPTLPPPPPIEASTSASKSTSQKIQSPQEAAAIWNLVREQNKQCGDLITELRKIIDKKGVKGLILTPRTSIDTRISLVSWGRQENLLWPDEKEIGRFLDAYRGKKPVFPPN